MPKGWLKRDNLYQVGTWDSSHLFRGAGCKGLSLRMWRVSILPDLTHKGSESGKFIVVAWREYTKGEHDTYMVLWVHTYVCMCRGVCVFRGGPLAANTQETSSRSETRWLTIMTIRLPDNGLCKRSQGQGRALETLQWLRCGLWHQKEKSFCQTWERTLGKLFNLVSSSVK